MIKIYSQPGPDFMQGIFSKGRSCVSPFLKLVCCYLFIMLPTWANAQTVINGTVKDTKGLPAIGATVSEKGNKNTAVTDINDKFKLTLKGKSGILTVTYIGYKPQEVTI